MIRIAICDDDSNMIGELKDKLITYMDEKHQRAQIRSFSSGEDLLSSDESFDIVFLDIQMTGMNGMEAARRLRQSGSESFFVFVSILKEYVYDAFSVEASGFLLKPLDDCRFRATLDRLLRSIQNQQSSILTVQKGTWCKSIPFVDILYCEAINRKIFVHTKQEVIDYYFKMKELEKKLTPDFFCCHRSYLVNLRAVCGYEKGLAKLSNGENLPVSRLRQQEFMEAMLTYMKKGDK
ncbi:response regulator transcription factor [Aminipila butyrica]|uniref:Stage 0 sporulation protein A homolog n=1 Tax=Aminipila butyrica TaxID=433296 RepID=A0A858BZX4_9FIRM|nr:LytTR family DNA-binding domain-containing protein [Aminipila butyrica]QIB70334.1 response regulator transcription factor [Aminipila butyrica]